MLTEDYNRALEIVSRISEISIDDILSPTKRMEVVDARGLLIKALTELGYYPNQIAYKMNRTPEGVRYLLNNYIYRETANKILKRLSEEISKELKNK